MRQMHMRRHHILECSFLCVRAVYIMPFSHSDLCYTTTSTSLQDVLMYRSVSDSEDKY